ncbi:hypothetical protein [Pelagibius sp.]|uniref:hypothetical protein n=1 Tax=Pelagibius sp. TaxID=1931238 RepID=UPI003B5016D2
MISRAAASLASVSLLVFVVLAWVPEVVAEEGRWVSLANDPDCQVWNPMPNSNMKTFVFWDGGCSDGKADGKGTLQWSSHVSGLELLDRYDGGIRRGKIHGEGTITTNSGWVTSGYFIDGLLHGHGVSSFPKGVRFEGNYQSNRRHGLGKLTLPNGDTCEAEFSNGSQVGIGRGVQNGVETVCQINALNAVFSH